MNQPQNSATGGVVIVQNLRAGYTSPLAVFSARSAIIIDGLDFTFMPGTIHGIVGKNGSGKSTLLKAVIDEKARLGGKVLCGAKTLSHADVAFVPQASAATLSPWLTVAEEAALPLRARGVPESEWRAIVKERMDRLGLNLPLERRINALSGGQRVATALLRAACIPQPRLWVLDEPTEGLDAPTRSLVLNVIRTIAETEAIPVLLTSHRLQDLVLVGARMLAIPSSPFSSLQPVQVPQLQTKEDAGTDTIDANGDALSMASIEDAAVSPWAFVRQLLLGCLGILAGVFGWWLCAILISNPSLLPTPQSVGRELIYVVADAELRSDLWATLRRIGIAWICGNLLAIPLGLVCGYERRVFQMLSPWLTLLRSVPIFALLGVAAGLFANMPEVQRLVLITLTVGALSLQTVAAASALVARARMDIARILGASWFFRLVRILPYEARASIFAALETSLPLATVLCFVIELFLIPQAGLGRHLYAHFYDRDLSKLFAFILIPAILSVPVIAVVRGIARRNRFE